MKAILLAGGYGTRLFPLTLRIPKVMVPVAGKPSLEHVVAACVSGGIRDIVISLNTTQKAIEDYFDDGKKWDAKISYVYEETKSDSDKLGAIGAVQYAAKAAGIEGECVIIGGDNVFYGLDLNSLRSFHSEKKSNATIALYELSDRKDVEQYGVVELDGKGRVVRIQEKPRESEAVSKLASMAVYHLDEAFLKECLPKFIADRKAEGRKPDKLGELWGHFLSSHAIYGKAFPCMWGDTNSTKTYVESNRQAMRFIVGNAQAKTGWHATDGETIQIRGKPDISPHAHIKGPCIVEDGAEIGDGASVGGGTYVGRNAKIGGRAVVSGSILFRDCEVGAGARVTHSVLDIGAKAGRDANVEPYCIVGYGASVGADAHLVQESRIWPQVQVADGAIISGDVVLAEGLWKEKVMTRELF
ncbi:NDP-sugar synthase [Candidatus Micrarchaeota archaeon]|nr:NDP-sugar synthase [Candidatus Micrarchaeota archaeon]